MFLLKLEKFINQLSELLGKLSGILFLLLVLNVTYDVIMRYVFNTGSIGMQELEWHLYAAIFLLGTPYALRHDGHVRVDLFYDRWSLKTQAIVNIIGTLLLLLPFTLLVVWFAKDFVMESYNLGEGSGDPGGLPHRWIIKSVIPLSFSFMAISGVGMILYSINVLRGHHQNEHHKSSKTELA